MAGSFMLGPAGKIKVSQAEKIAMDGYSVAMRFEERELKPYAEPVKAADLKEGAIYFGLTYADDEMLIPTMETVIFVGRNLEPADRGQVYFQDIHSYRAGVRYDTTGNDIEARFSTGSEKEVDHIFEYESALNELLRCSLRRRDRRSGDIRR